MKYERFLDIIDKIFEVLIYWVISTLIIIPILSIICGVWGLINGEGFFYVLRYYAEYLIVSPAAWVGSLLGILYVKIFR